MAAATWTSTNSGQGRSVKAVSASGSADAPTLATEGMSLDGVAEFTIILSADSAKTLSGGGTLLCYVYDANPGRWARLKGLDIDISSLGVASVRDNAFEGYTVTGARGRIAFIPSSVTVSAGGVTVYHNAVDKMGRAV